LKRKASAREIAMNVLTKVEQERAYSNLLLNQSLQMYKLERIDASLTTEIVYGTIQRLNTIDYFLNRFVQKGLTKLEPWVRSLLRLSFYQLYYLDKIPEHAAVHEAVAIAKRKGHQGISGMVNGVLRNVIRNKADLKVPDHLSAVERIALEHSHPQWMVSRWIKQYGEKTAEDICRSNNEPPRVSVRVNTMRHDPQSMAKLMAHNGLSVRRSALSPSGIIVEGSGNMALTDWYKEGDISIQDESSMLVAEVVRPEPGMEVLDCCAAPGGKTAHMAEKMKDRGVIYAVDIHPHKQKLIQEQAARLGLGIVETVIHDAQSLPDRFADGSFDRILLDAPCSGLGVIRRKPDLKWNKEESEIADISQLQYDILCSVQRLLRADGILVYSTCTIEYEENQGLIQKFLGAHPEFELETALDELLPDEGGEASRRSSLPGTIQILPHDFHSDGFFIARLRKK
jgi:16S rRNA (cytosine967-C5)-methyltransferase